MMQKCTMHISIHAFRDMQMGDSVTWGGVCGTQSPVSSATSDVVKKR